MIVAVEPRPVSRTLARHTPLRPAWSLLVPLFLLMARPATPAGLVLHLPFDGSAVPAAGKELGTPEVRGEAKTWRAGTVRRSR